MRYTYNYIVQIQILCVKNSSVFGILCVLRAHHAYTYITILTLVYPFVIGLPRGNAGEDLRMTAEPCGGGELIRITTLSSPGPQSPSSRSQHYDPEYAKIEAWLDEHRDFAYDYFLRYTYNRF